jgi:hypothetical protein
MDKKAYTMETVYSSMKEKTTRHSTFDGQPLKPSQEGLRLSSTSHCGPSLLTAINSSSLWVPPLHPDPAIVHCEFLCSKSLTTTDMQDYDSWIVQANVCRREWDAVIILVHQTWITASPFCIVFPLNWNEDKLWKALRTFVIISTPYLVPASLT